MNFWWVVLIGVIVAFVLAFAQYVHKRKSRKCEYCDGEWDGICPDCKAKLFPEEEKKTK